MFIEIFTTTLFPVHFPKTTIASSSSTALTIARGHLIKTITSTCVTKKNKPIHPFQSTTTTVYVRPKSKQKESKHPNYNYNSTIHNHAPLAVSQMPCPLHSTSSFVPVTTVVTTALGDPLDLVKPVVVLVNGGRSPKSPLKTMSIYL
jgi:hypothetical protein